MGNCAAPQAKHATTSWADDGEWEESWSSEEEENEERRKHMTEEVTIRITKRQLQEMLEKKARNGKGRPPAEQLLADIMNAGEVHHHHHRQDREAHWKPALHSIPEAVES